MTKIRLWTDAAVIVAAARLTAFDERTEDWAVSQDGKARAASTAAAGNRFMLLSRKR